MTHLQQRRTARRQSLTQQSARSTVGLWQLRPRPRSHDGSRTDGAFRELWKSFVQRHHGVGQPPQSFDSRPSHRAPQCCLHGHWSRGSPQTHFKCLGPILGSRNANQISYINVPLTPVHLASEVAEYYRVVININSNYV